MTTTISPYGSWKSPITADWSPAAKSVWSKSASTATTFIGSSGAPKKAGRKVIVRRAANGEKSPMSRRQDSMRAPACTNTAAAIMQFPTEQSSFPTSPISGFIFKNSAAQPQPLTPSGSSATPTAKSIGAKSFFLRARRSLRQGEAVNTMCCRSQRRRRGQDRRFGKRLLLFAPTEPRRLAAGLAHLESSEHAVGRH